MTPVAGPSPQAWDAYVSWFHDTNVWKSVAYRGVRTLKLPLDLWNYQEILFERGIESVVETGTRHGGSALFFADVLQARGASGIVVTIDLDASARHVQEHSRIRFLNGDSGDPAMAERAFGMLPAPRGPLFVILDSDHSCDHVLREMEAFVPQLRPGDYLVVEDTNLNGRPVRPGFGPGPGEAVERFVARHPGLLVPDRARERKFGATFAPGGYFVRAGAGS
jgi:cephalosporin hydroxylase